MLYKIAAELINHRSFIDPLCVAELGWSFPVNLFFFLIYTNNQNCSLSLCQLRITVWSLCTKSVSYIKYPKACQQGKCHTPGWEWSFDVVERENYFNVMTNPIFGNRVWSCPFWVAPAVRLWCLSEGFQLIHVPALHMCICVVFASEGSFKTLNYAGRAPKEKH